MEAIVSKVYAYLIAYGVNVIAAILIFVIGKWLAGVVSRLLEKIILRGNTDKTLASFVRHLTYIGLLVFVIIAAISKLGVQTTSLVAIIGAAGLAVGLALQGSLANFAAGLMLVIFRPFKVGDLVETGGTLGTVEEIQIFNTIINALDNRRVIVPNAKVTGDNIVNLSAIENRRVDLVFWNLL